MAAYADLTGRRIVLPRPSRSPLGRCAQIEAARTQWTRQRPQSAAQGDVALMHPRRGVWHVGIGIEDSGGLVVLHVDRERGTVVDTVSRLERLLGMRLDGWYRWIG
ncbi:MAG: hypothetical protein OXI15_16745 [Chromatiales bacterium]|nr:hypothetical protein [Chromatiales bacterium]